MREMLPVLVGVLLLFACAFAVCYGLYLEQALPIRLENDLPVVPAEELGLMTQIETARIASDDRVIVEGWLLHKDRNVHYMDLAVVLKSMQTAEYIQIATAFVERTDITTRMGAGYDYDNTGFFASVEQERLYPGSYEVYIRYNIHDEDVLIATDKHILVEQEEENL